MVRHTDARGLTADAYALSRALSTYRVKLSHQQCLDVLAKTRGHTTYEEMLGAAKAEEPSGRYEERIIAVYEAMGARLARWWNNRRCPGGAPAQLMAEAYSAGTELRAEVTEQIAQRGLEGIYPFYLTLVQEGVAIRVEAVRAEENGYRPENSGRNPWRLVEVHFLVNPGGNDSEERIIENAAVELYKRYLETVEVIAKGYAVCMEMFHSDAQYLGEGENQTGLVWRFYEADESSIEAAAQHPMARCGEYFICATEPLRGTMGRGMANMVVGLWHVHESALTGKSRWESMREDVEEVFERAKPMRLSLGDGKTPAFNWKYLHKVLSEGKHWAVPELLEAVRKATDGAELMMAAGVRGWVRIEGGRVVDGFVVVDASDTHKRRAGSNVLEQDEVDRLMQVIQAGLSRGLLKVTGVKEGSGQTVTVVPTSVEGGYASRLMLR